MAALLKETKRRLGKETITYDSLSGSNEEKAAQYADFYAILYGVAREFFCYYMKNKSSTAVSVYMGWGGVGGSDTPDYVVHNDFSCSCSYIDSKPSNMGGFFVCG